MAVGAGRTGRRECAANMAGLTSDARVGTIQYKSSAEMIERLLRHGVARDEQRKDGCGQD